MIRAPDYAEPVVGWRVWAVTETDLELRLRSLMFENTWLPGQAFAADCGDRPGSISRVWRRTPRAHPAPEASCRCGIYATKRLADIARYARCLGSRPSMVLHRAVGRVALWGSVLEHTGGWRAAQAYPLELFVPLPPGRQRRAESVALALTDYGVRVELVDAANAADLLTVLQHTAAASIAA